MPQNAAKDAYNQSSTRSPMRGIRYQHWYQKISDNQDQPDFKAATAHQDHAPLRLSDLLRDIWKAKRLIALGALIGAVCAGIFIFSAVPHYKAEMVLSPAKPMSNNAISSFENDSNNFSALSFLMRYSGVSQSSEFSRFETMARGPSIARDLLQDQRILNGLSQDRNFRFFTPEKSWNAAIMSDYLQARVNFEPTPQSGMRKISYLHNNPEFAAYMIGRIHSITDGKIRERIRTETDDRIAYLRSNLDQTNHPDHRRALTSLLLEQERTRMLVAINQPFAANVIEVASASSKTLWPNKSLIFSVLILVGGFLGYLTFELRRQR